MGEELIFSKINTLLAEGNYPKKIHDFNALKSFLTDPNNQKVSTFNEIEELYDLLVVGPGMW